MKKFILAPALLLAGCGFHNEPWQVPQDAEVYQFAFGDCVSRGVEHGQCLYHAGNVSSYCPEGVRCTGAFNRSRDDVRMVLPKGSDDE